jgi:GT2 family glycosyltransferase
LRAAVRGWRPDDVVWEYDLLLRITEALADDAIVHLPAVLYHRHAPATDATSAEVALRRLAVEAHLARTGRDGWKAALGASGAVRVIAPLPQPAPLVSIIVPTRDRADLLETCLEGLLNRTDYPALEILIVDNDSREARTRRLFETATADPRVRILPYPDRFNWGRINNFAVGHARGDVVVLLNNDTDVIDPDWLTELAAQAVRPEIGVVGATLLYPDQTLQHAGIVLGPAAEVEHVGRRRPANDPGYGGRMSALRSVSAVTGACMALRKEVYLAVGGIEEDIRVAWSDTDLCLKAWAQGLRVIVTPHARLFHIELATRGSDATPEAAERFAAERDWMRRRWGERLNSDPFFSANFTPDWAELRLNYQVEI